MSEERKEEIKEFYNEVKIEKELNELKLQQELGVG